MERVLQSPVKRDSNFRTASPLSAHTRTVDKNSLSGTKSGKKYGGVMQQRLPQYLVRPGNHINHSTKDPTTKKYEH
jgi:hypothetical protein